MKTDYLKVPGRPGQIDYDREYITRALDLLENREKAENLAQKARTGIFEIYSWEKITDEWTRIFQPAFGCSPKTIARIMIMTDWLKKNLEILEARRPDLAAMAGEEPGPGFGLVMARDGGPCLVAWRNSREISLESRFEPDLEAVNWARKALSGRPGAAVVHGMALGRHVNELIKNSNDLPLALVEPEPDVFRLAVRTFDQ